MPALSPADLTALRARPIGRLWKLYVYQPETMWTGTVGGAPDQGETTLSVTTLTGNLANMLAGMTMRVTDSLGNPKIQPSKARYKSYNAVGPTVTLAENAIDWAAGDLLAGVRLFEIWPRIPHIDPGTGTQYKDTDIAWVSDAQAQPPKANAGPAAIATLVGGQADVVFADAGSYECPGGGAVASYQWQDYGGTPAVVAGNPATNTVTYRYTAAGYYYVRLTVTDANGITGAVYVPVIIDDGTLAQPVDASDRYWDTHGWVLGRRLPGIDATDSAFYDGAPCFLVADTADVPTGAFASNRSNLRWSGWLAEDTTQRRAYDREITYRAVSTAHVLANVPAYPTGMRDDAAPADWYEFTDLSINSVAHLLMLWHSTVFWVADYHAFTEDEWAGGASERLRPAENCDAKDLLSQVNAVLKAAMGGLLCDRQGILRAQRHEWYLSAAELAARTTVLTLQHSDIAGAGYGPHKHRATVRETRLSGVDATNEPYLSGAPGPSPLDGGMPSETQRLAPLDQDELTQWAGQDLAVKNWDTVVTLQMSGEYDCVDPALGEFVAGTLSAWDSRIPDGDYRVTGVRFTDDHLLGYTVGEWTLQSEPGMYGASAREIPAEPPPLPPDPPPFIPPPPPVEEVEDYDIVIIGTVEAGVCVTENAVRSAEGDTVWRQENTGLADITNFIESLVLDPLAPDARAACIDSSGEVYVRTAILAGDAVDGGWTLALSQAAALTLGGAGYTTAEISQLCAGHFRSETYLAAVVNFDVASSYPTTKVMLSMDWGTSWTKLGGPPSGAYHTFVLGDCDYWRSNYMKIRAKSTQDTFRETNGGCLFTNTNQYQGFYLVLCGFASKAVTGRSNFMVYRVWASAQDAEWYLAGRPRTDAMGYPVCGNPVDPSNESVVELGCSGYSVAYHDAIGGPICRNQATGSLYVHIGAWRAHEDDTAAGDWIEAYVDIGAIKATLYPSTDVVSYGWAAKPGQLFAKPDDLAGYYALYITDAPDKETEIYNDNGQTACQTLTKACRSGACWPRLEGESSDQPIIYLGGSYADGEKYGDIGAEHMPDELFYVALDENLRKVYNKTGNLIALGATAVTDICPVARRM